MRYEEDIQEYLKSLSIFTGDPVARQARICDFIRLISREKNKGKGAAHNARTGVELARHLSLGLMIVNQEILGDHPATHESIALRHEMVRKGLA